MGVLGGMGTIIGPILGAVVITFLLETMRVFAEYRLIIYGLLMFLMILYMPGGLASLSWGNFWPGKRWGKRDQLGETVVNKLLDVHKEV